MKYEDADKLKAQVEMMTWEQLVTLWKWLTLVIYKRIAEGKAQ